MLDTEELPNQKVRYTRSHVNLNPRLIKLQSCPQDLLNMKNLQKYELSPASPSKLFVAAKLYMILNHLDLISADKSGDPF